MSFQDDVSQIVEDKYELILILSFQNDIGQV